ncbi:gag-pol polyprotein [Nephila pilipes]|uniref:Gag-pol polyprotein n=1 Tax=Nephila pilipes TaxID=299642 RepID=A0A8X6T7K4_NEPPI|nr:gag-pol polyprotein [Nephila pilipes]
MLNECDNKQIAHVAVKTPPFWKYKPTLWFVRLKAQFDLAKISNDTSKFNYVLSAVELDILNSVSDLVVKPPEKGKYEVLNKTSNRVTLGKHLDFISQFSTDIRHVLGSDNSAADALSRINALNLSTTDLQHLADSQTKDEELKTLISSNDLSIKLKPLKMGNALEIFCDVSGEKVRPYVPEELRFEVFRSS